MLQLIYNELYYHMIPLLLVPYKTVFFSVVHYYTIKLPTLILQAIYYTHSVLPFTFPIFIRPILTFQTLLHISNRYTNI